MFKQIAMVFVVGYTLFASTGCYVCFNGPRGGTGWWSSRTATLPKMGGNCADGSCSGGCASAAPAESGCTSVCSACTPHTSPACGCSTGHCGGDGCGSTPLQYHAGCKWCNCGCGETYWSEWFNDPPESHDPCDHCGNWTGDHGNPVRVPHAWEKHVRSTCTECGE